MVISRRAALITLAVTLVVVVVTWGWLQMRHGYGNSRAHGQSHRDLLPPPPPGTRTPELDLINRPGAERDLAVLTLIERITGTTPGPVAHDLLALRRAGAAPAALEDFISLHFDGLVEHDLKLALRRQAAGEALATNAPSVPNVRKPIDFGDGRGPFEHGQTIGTQIEPAPSQGAPITH